MNSHFSQADLEAIESAVKQSETHTSGEIVPVFIEKCTNYPIAMFRAGAALAGLVFLIIVLMERFVEGFILYDPLWHLLAVILAGLTGALAVKYIPSLQRWVVGKKILQEMAFHKANQFFLKEEVFKTRDRTGIMIFIAWFEHQVIVMADKGITKVVAQEDWDHIVNDLVSSIRQKQLKDGLIHAVNACAALLSEKGVAIKPDDKDELSNKLRME